MSRRMKFFEFLISKIFLKNLGIALVLSMFLIFASLLWLKLFTQHGRTRPIPDFYGLTLTEADGIASDKKLKVEIVDSIYSISAEKGTIVEQNPRAGKMVKKNRRVFLIINAINTEMVIMPDVVGITHRQAKATLEMTGLEVGRLSYVHDIAVNSVLKQMYKGKEIEFGDTIPKGVNIDLVLGTGLSNRKTLAPELTGMSFAQARNSILNASLNMGAVLYDETVLTEEDSLEAFVWKQNPEYSEDRKVRLGSPVYLWLSLDSLKLPQPDTINLISLIQDENIQEL